jgi:hypothetical protein
LCTLVLTVVNGAAFGSYFDLTSGSYFSELTTFNLFIMAPVAVIMTLGPFIGVSDVPGWASSPEPTEPGPFKPKPGPTRMRA